MGFSMPCRTSLICSYFRVTIELFPRGKLLCCQSQVVKPFLPKHGCCCTSLQINTVGLLSAAAFHSQYNCRYQLTSRQDRLLASQHFSLCSCHPNFNKRKMKNKIHFLFWMSLNTLSWMNMCNGVPVAVKAGQRATLTCPLRTDSHTQVISWYRQSRGLGPQFVLSYLVHNATHLFYGRGLNSSHFAVRGSEGRTVLQQLEITTATRNDTAVYYCGVSF